MSFVLEVVEQYSKEGLMLKMKFQHLGYLMWRPSSLEETLMLGKIVGRRRGNKRMRLWDGITYSKDMSLQKLHEIVKDREGCFVAEQVITKSQIWLSNWTIPIRIQGPLKALVLVGWSRERFHWKGRLHILWCRSLKPRQGAQDFECVTKHYFLKKTKNCFLQERELWLSLFSRFYWGMSKGSGVGWVCKNQVTNCWRVRLVVDILH